jgi:hypothetical protein
MQRDGPAHYVLWPAKDAGQPFLREDGPSFTSDKVMLRDHQSRARIASHVLRMHCHAADQKQRAAALIERIGHYRAERPTRMLRRKARQRSDAADMRQGACPLAETRLGHGRLRTRPRGVLS